MRDLVDLWTDADVMRHLGGPRSSEAAARAAAALLRDGGSLLAVGAHAAPELIAGRSSLDAFSAASRAFLALVEREHPECTAIDATLAVPVSVAVELGRQRMRSVHPPLRLWERTSEGYAYAGCSTTCDPRGPSEPWVAGSSPAGIARSGGRARPGVQDTT